MAHWLLLNIYLIILVQITNGGDSGPGNCGMLDQTSSRIIKGYPVSKNFPWFATFYKTKRNEDVLNKNPTEIKIECGGALITSRHALTAAHCYSGVAVSQRPSFFRVALNMLNRCGGDRLIVHVQDVFVNYNHLEKWDPVPAFDIAMVVLATDVPNTPICLPSLLEYSEREALAIGFGSTSPDENHMVFPCQLLSARLIVHTREHCLKTNYEAETMSERTICAHSYNYNIDPCFGDSGSPLMVYNHGRYELVGVLSYGKVCAGYNWPKIYTDTTLKGFGKWIEEQLRNPVDKKQYHWKRRNKFYRYGYNSTIPRVYRDSWKRRKGY